MIVYECNTAVIDYIEEKEYLYVKWIDYTLATNFRDIIDFKIDFLLKNQIHQVLTDITKHRIFAPSEQEFDRDVTVLLYNTIGIYKNAIIMNPRSSAAGSAFRFKRMVNDAVNKELIQLFETEEKALEWLLS